MMDNQFTARPLSSEDKAILQKLKEKAWLTWLRVYPLLFLKYQDPFTDKCLLFYPGKEDLYIEVCKEDFESIGNGENLYLEVASVTGEVLSLKSGDRIFKAPAEFSYSDR